MKDGVDGDPSFQIWQDIWERDPGVRRPGVNERGRERWKGCCGRSFEDACSGTSEIRNVDRGRYRATNPRSVVCTPKSDAYRRSGNGFSVVDMVEGVKL